MMIRFGVSRTFAQVEGSKKGGRPSFDIRIWAIFPWDDAE